MVPFEVSIAILNHIADSRLVLLNNCGHWTPFEKPAEWTAQVLSFLKGYRAGWLPQRWFVKNVPAIRTSYPIHNFID
jgi:2-hydroxy-6-oxonona-2,4-dienedioate hydrolase